MRGGCGGCGGCGCGGGGDGVSISTVVNRFMTYGRCTPSRFQLQPVPSLPASWIQIARHVKTRNHLQVK